MSGFGFRRLRITARTIQQVELQFRRKCPEGACVAPCWRCAALSLRMQIYQEEAAQPHWKIQILCVALVAHLAVLKQSESTQNWRMLMSAIAQICPGSFSG